MSNRDGKKAKPNKRNKFGVPNTKCPNCRTTLEKCGSFGKGHDYHRYCPSCKYSNF